MKKTLLATAILSGLISATAGAATVYNEDGTKLSIGGRAEVRGLFSDSVDGTMEDQSRARINVAGETQISENLTAFGFAEYEIKESDTDEDNLDSRYLFVGLGTQYGDFSYGKQVTANVQVVGFSDIANYHSGNQQIARGAKDNADNVFLYSATFDALTVQADYQAVDEKDADTYAVSAVYGFDFGLDLGASYSAANAADSADEQYQASFAAAYTRNALYVAATYTMGDLSDTEEFNGLEATAKYQFTEQIAVIGIYGKTELEEAGVTTDTNDFFALEANYSFNPSMVAFASYKINELDDAEDELVLGAKYTF